MRNTENLGLALYDVSDKMSITAAENSLNHNMELLDTEVAKKMDAPGAGEAGHVLTKTGGGYEWGALGYITPQMYGAKGDGTTDDSAVFQLLVDKLKKTGGTIVLSGQYLLQSDIIIKRHSNTEFPITFLGVNDATILFGGSAAFTGENNNYGNIKFINVTFKGSYIIDNETIGNSTIFRADGKLIRVHCDNCTFSGIENIVLATGVTQSYYFTNCIMWNCGYVINGTADSSRGYDIKINLCRVERCQYVFYMPKSPSYETVISNCCIESIGTIKTINGIESIIGCVASFGIVRTAKISDNYFEDNSRYIVCNDQNVNNLIVEGNNMTDEREVCLVELPNQVIYPHTLKIIRNNITDVTVSPHIHTPLSSDKTLDYYTGLIIEENNKERSDGIIIRRSKSTIEKQSEATLHLEIPASEITSLTDGFKYLAEYAHQNNYLDSNFWCDMGGLAILRGNIVIKEDKNRIYINAFGTDKIYSAVISSLTYNGSIYTAQMTLLE